MFFWQGTILMVFRWFLVQATSGSIVAQNQANSAMVTWLPVGQLLGLMVFQWFLGQRQPSGLIVFYGCPLLVKRCDVHLLLLKSTSNEWNSELFDRMGKRSKLLSGFARYPDVQILPLLYCCCVPLPRTNLFFYIVPDISNLVIFPMRLCCVVVLLFCSHVFVAFSCVQLPNLAILPTHRCCFERRQEEERDEMRGQSFMRRQKLSPHVGD